jgi:hypothetical protein
VGWAGAREDFGVAVVLCRPLLLLVPA